MKKMYLLFFLLSLGNVTFAQDANDCVGALDVYSNEAISYNVYEGPGLKQEIDCGTIEHNSLWLKLNIVKYGTLGFNLKPHNKDIAVDFDFWVFGPYASCPVSNYNRIRCCTTNPKMAGLSNNYTGMKESSSDLIQGPGASGTGYVKWLTVTSGQTYYLVIDNLEYDRGGFDIEWTGTALIGSSLSVDNLPLNDFKKATVCPNPFNNAFVIDVNTLSQEMIKIKVYDMLGKLIEQKEVSPDAISAERIGSNYSSGIYNIILNQEDEVKTLRVIKE